MYRCNTKQIEYFNHSQKEMLVKPAHMWRKNIISTNKRSCKWIKCEQ